MTPDPIFRWDDMVLVGQVARPHGLRGQVVVNPETDFAEARFQPGAIVWMQGADGIRPLTVASSRLQNGRPVVAFEGMSRREDVEPLAGRELRIPEGELQPLAAGQYYEHQLVGCSVETVGGTPVGTVTKVEGGAGGSRLVVGGARGEILIPLAVDICVGIDVARRQIRIDPPEGLLELNEIRHRHDLPGDGAGEPGRGGREPGDRAGADRRRGARPAAAHDGSPPQRR